MNAVSQPYMEACRWQFANGGNYDFGRILLESTQFMEKKLKDLLNDRIEVTCGTGLVFCGVLKTVENDFIEVSDEHGDPTVVAIEKIIAVRKSVDPTHRPGFVV